MGRRLIEYIYPILIKIISDKTGMVQAKKGWLVQAAPFFGLEPKDLAAFGNLEGEQDLEGSGPGVIVVWEFSHQDAPDA